MWRARGFANGYINIAGGRVEVREHLIAHPESLTPAQVEHLTRSPAWTHIAPAVEPLAPTEQPPEAREVEGEQSPEPAPKRRGRPKKVSP